MMTKTNLSIEKIKTALENNDGKVTLAANEIGVKYPTIMWWIKKHNIPFNNQNKIKATPEELWEAYKELQSTQKVAEKFGCQKDGVRYALMRNGYKLNKLVRYKCNENFFKHETQESLYWAGFIAADGCVKKNKNRHDLQIGLSQKDKLHLEKFKLAIDYDGPIRDFLVKNSKRNPKWNDTWKSEIAITSKQIFDDLHIFNIVPRKSLIYTFPTYLINNPMVHHFMRGYFDGDGSFYWSNPETKSPQEYFSLRGTVEFLTTYRSILESNNLVTVRNKPIRTNNGIGVLEYGGNKVVNLIKDFLSKDATIELDRKWGK
jgi:hypothetical protein